MNNAGALMQLIRIGGQDVYLYDFGLRHEDINNQNQLEDRIDRAPLVPNNFRIVPPYQQRPRPPHQPPLEIFATNYNVFRIMSGMGGLAYGDGPAAPVNREGNTSTRDLGQFEYVFKPEKETQTDTSKYEYNLVQTNKLG